MNPNEHKIYYERFIIDCHKSKVIKYIDFINIKYKWKYKDNNKDLRFPII